MSLIARFAVALPVPRRMPHTAFGRGLAAAMALAALIGMALAPSAMAQKTGLMVRAQDPQSLVKVLHDNGYQAKLGKDTIGDPMITSGASGRSFTILFFGCTKNRDCATVQFFASFTGIKPSLAQINSWNSKNRFGRAYIADTGMARLEMDVDLDDGGISPDLFVDNVEFWDAVMNSFQSNVMDEVSED